MLRDLNKTLDDEFSIHFQFWWLRCTVSLVNKPSGGCHWALLLMSQQHQAITCTNYIDAGNGGNKPWTEPMLSEIDVATLYH